MTFKAAILSVTLVVCGSSNGIASTSVSLDGRRLVASTLENSNHSFKSFREWKSQMTITAQDKIKQTQILISQKQRQSASMAQDPNLPAKATLESGLNQSLAELQQQAEKEQYQLSVAKDLTISDYFVGYLTKQKDLSSAIKDVAGRLTPDEVSELMYAYANNFFTSKPSTTISPARADLTK